MQRQNAAFNERKNCKRSIIFISLLVASAFDNCDQILRNKRSFMKACANFQRTIQRSSLKIRDRALFKIPRILNNARGFYLSTIFIRNMSLISLIPLNKIKLQSTRVLVFIFKSIFLIHSISSIVK